MPITPARNSKYTFYAIGGVDPNFKHIWGFNSSAERDTFLTAHLGLSVSGNKFWKPGSTIRANFSTANDFSFEKSFWYDYVKIENRAGSTQEMVYYCFIIERKYINLNLTELTLAIDWIQTFYFNSDNTPFWSVGGYGVATTDLSVLPPRGIGNEFPILSKRNLWQWKNDDTSIGYIVYSSNNISATYVPVQDEEGTLYLDDPTLTSADAGLANNLFMGSQPYMINCTTQYDTHACLSILNNNLNNTGQIGAITGIYAVPSAFFSGKFNGIKPLYSIHHGSSGYSMVELTVNVPSAATLFTAAGLTVQNPILKGYGYTKISVTNQIGENVDYCYEDFSADPIFKVGVSLAAGMPIIYCYPSNYKFGSVSQSSLFAMKQANPPQCSLLTDNYAIWQAQNRNSIAASREAAQLTVANAKEAQSKTGGIATMLDNLFDKGNDTLSNMASSLGLDLSGDLGDAVTSAGYGGMNALLSTGFLSSLGLQASYTYEQQTKVAEQALRNVEAQFKDMQYLPNSASGSNAYGDLMALLQYGFCITVTSPTSESLGDLDAINNSNGHICKGLVTCRQSRTVFDYWRMIEAKISNSPYNRPQFVNNMMVKLFADGLYLWWYNNGDIDTLNFGHPYKLTNGGV